MMTYKDQLDVHACANLYIEVAKNTYPTVLKDWKLNKIHFTIRGTTAGKARFSKNEIFINPGLFVRNREKFFETTIPHEIAHLIAFAVFRDNGHGEGWKHVMRLFKVPVNRCHTYDTTEVRQKYTIRRYFYSCDCSNSLIVVSSQKHNEHTITGKKKYNCRICKSEIRYNNQFKELVRK